MSATEYRITGMGLDRPLDSRGRDQQERIGVFIAVGKRPRLEVVEISEDAALVYATKLIEAVRVLRNRRATTEAGAAGEGRDG